MAEKAGPSVELANVGVTIMPVLKGMAKQIRSQVSEGARGSANAIGAELNKALKQNTTKMRSEYGAIAKAYRTEMNKIRVPKATTIPTAGTSTTRTSVAETRRQRRERIASEREEQNALLKEQAKNIANSLSRGIGGAFSGIGRGLAGLTRTFTRGLSRVVSGIAPTLRTIGGGIRGLGSSMMNYVIPPATAAAAAIGAIGVNAVRTGVQYNTLQQTTRAGLKTLLGSAKAANEQMDRLDEFATTSPFAKQTFIEAQQQLLAFNFAAEEVIPTLDAIQNQVAAMGGSNQQIKEIASIFAKIRSSQLISMQDINQLAERGINAPKLLAEAMNTTEEAMREDLMGDPVRGRDAIDALNMIINAMAESNRGAAENVKNTWVGAIDRIKAAWRDMSSWIATPFVDPMGGGMAVEWANGIADAFRQIERAIREFVTANRGEIEAFFAPVGGAIRNATEALKEFNGSHISQFLSNINAMKDVLIPLGVFFGVVFGSSLLSGIPLIGALVPAIGPVVGAFLAIAAVSPELRAALGDLFGVILAGIPPLMPVLERLIGILEGAFISTLQFITPYVEQFMQLLPGLLMGFLDFAEYLAAGTQEVMPILMELAQIVGTFLIDAFYAILPYLPIIADAFVRLGGALLEAFGEIWQTLGPQLPDIINTLVGAFLVLVDVLIELLPYVVDLLNFIIENHEAFFMLATFAAVAWGTLKLFSGLGAIFGPVVGLIGGVARAFGGTGGLLGAARGAFSGIGRLIPGLAGALGGLTLPILGVASVFGMAFYAVWKDWDTLVAGFSWGFEQIGKGGALLGEALVTGFSVAFEGIWQMLQGLWGGLTDLWGWIGDRTWNRTDAAWRNDTPSPPRYANGGLVPATPGGRLIIAGEAGRNEVVVDEGLFNRNLELQNRALAGIAAGRGAGAGSPTIIENITIQARQDESNESLLRRARRVFSEPDLLAGF